MTPDRARLCVVQEPEVERREDQDNANVGCKAFPDMASEEQDIHGDDDTYHRNRVQHAGCRPSHRASLAAESDASRLRQRSGLTPEDAFRSRGEGRLDAELGCKILGLNKAGW